MDREDERSLHLNIPFQRMGAILQQFAAQNNASAEQLQSTSGALAQFDSRADLEIVLSGSVGFFGGKQWGVQVYANDQGSSTDIVLVALGTSFGADFIREMRSAIVGSDLPVQVSLAKSIEKRDQLITMLQQQS